MPQRFLSIKNFEKYQKTKEKDGNRPWVKLWKSILNDPAFMELTPHDRFVYIALILLADDSNNKIYGDHTYLRQRLYITHTEGIRGAYIGHTKLNLSALYRSGLLNVSNLSRVLSETEAENIKQAEAEKTVTVLVDFEVFWTGYPRKEGKQKALAAWNKINPDHTLNTLILTRLEEHKASDQWKKDEGKFIPHASTWLNGKRWEDEMQKSNTVDWDSWGK